VSKHGKKIIAPVIVCICLASYYIVGGIILIEIIIPIIMKVMALIFSIALTIVLVAGLIERIKEIRSGEEDDLGKY
jgi:hypothetical protein